MNYKPIPTYISGLDNAIFGGFPPGTMILLKAPPIAETKMFLLNFLYFAVKNKEPFFFITSDDSSRNIKNYSKMVGKDLDNLEEKEKYLKFIDVFTKNANLPETEKDTIYVSSPLALSELAIAITNVQRDFSRLKNFQKGAFFSLSSLLLYNKPKTIYRFLMVEIGKLKATNSIVVFVIDEEMHEKSVVETIRHMMDATLKLEKLEMGISLTIENLPIPFPRRNIRIFFEYPQQVRL